MFWSDLDVISEYVLRILKFKHWKINKQANKKPRTGQDQREGRPINKMGSMEEKITAMNVTEDINMLIINREKREKSKTT